MRLLPLAMIAAALAGLSAAADARTKGVPPVKEAGPPEDCVQLQSIRETRVRDDRTIDFYMRGGKVYRNTLPGTCPQLGFEERFSYATSLSKLCSTDIITVLQSPGVTRGPSCGLGKFQPVTGAPR
ncbi:MAG: hypothetical protein JWM75_2699 [Sphingomonas bacterium]|jgi:hypothetical protein|nr:hypothetical protein [Sphingomonas bacterium]